MKVLKKISERLQGTLDALGHHVDTHYEPDHGDEEASDCIELHEVLTLLNVAYEKLDFVIWKQSEEGQMAHELRDEPSH